MTQAINPNTNIPMSLQVEKIQQLRNTHDMQQQGQLAQKSSIEKQRVQQRVIAKNETEQAQIRDNKEDKDNGNGKNSNKKQDHKHGNNENEDQLTSSLKKGRIIDVSI